MTQKWFGSLKIKVMLYVTHKEFEVSVLIRVCVCSKSLKSNWSRQIAALPSAWLLLLPVKRELFFLTVTNYLLTWDLIVGIFPVLLQGLYLAM